jgi:hypothetical protein
VQYSEQILPGTYEKLDLGVFGRLRRMPVCGQVHTVEEEDKEIPHAVHTGVKIQRELCATDAREDRRAEVQKTLTGYSLDAGINDLQ